MLRKKTFLRRICEQIIRKNIFAKDLFTDPSQKIFCEGFVNKSFAKMACPQVFVHFSRDSPTRFFTGGSPQTSGKVHIWRIPYSDIFLVWLRAGFSNLIQVSWQKSQKRLVFIRRFSSVFHGFPMFSCVSFV